MRPMDKNWNLGEVNGHIVGRVLKEAVRRATVAIRNERVVFEAQTKLSVTGTMDDICTSADKKAQEIYLRTLRECFPSCGVVAEEDHLKIEPSGGTTAWFTVDPLDGTRAYVRRQSHGIGTMIGLVDDDEVISAYVGDINTEETYGYRPGSNDVYRITCLDMFEEMTFHSPYLEKKSYVLLRDPLDRYSPLTRATVQDRFRSHLVDGASIGIWMARLWKREVAAAVITPAWETPWDSVPVVGISRKLGYVFMRPDESGARWERYDPPLRRESYRRDTDLLVVHQEDVANLLGTS